MKVFISWSGQPSKAVAETLYSWLPQVIQSVTPWMSEEDISAGTRWSAAIAGQLESARFGIICVTRENMNAPWLQFEAGALSKTLIDTYVCPYTFGLAPSDLRGPLSQFHGARADREGTRRLLRAINQAAGDTALALPQLDATFRVWWPRLYRALSNIQNNSHPNAKPLRNEDHLLKEILEHIRNPTPSPVVDLYFLVSFAPSSGVGLYEFGNATCRFAVESKGTGSVSNKLSLKGQVAAGYYFNSLNELLAFCRREYLGVKKSAYYSALFTKRVSKKELTEALQFLNQPSLNEIAVSTVVITALKEIASVEFVAQIVLRAYQQGLENVKSCLCTEFGEIVLSAPIVELLKNTSEGAAAYAHLTRGKRILAAEGR